MIRKSLLAMLLPLLSGACMVSAAPTGAKACRADAASEYVGQRYDERVGRLIRDKTHATDLRTLAPDTIVTQEFRIGRVNVALDSTNLVTRIYCG